MALWQYLRRWRSGRRDARRARASTASLPLQADHGSLARKRRRRWWALTVPVRHKACDTLTRARRRRQGRPIYIQHLGQINMKKMYEVTTEERMLKFHVQEYERCANYIMPACSIVAGRHIDQTFAIIDLKGARRGRGRGPAASARRGPRRPAREPRRRRVGTHGVAARPAATSGGAGRREPKCEGWLGSGVAGACTRGPVRRAPRTRRVM